jgi:hypothetical protein
MDKAWRRWDKISEKAGELNYQLQATKRELWAAKAELAEEPKVKRTRGGA